MRNIWGRGRGTETLKFLALPGLAWPPSNFSLPQRARGGKKACYGNPLSCGMRGHWPDWPHPIGIQQFGKISIICFVFSHPCIFSFIYSVVANIPLNKKKHPPNPPRIRAHFWAESITFDEVITLECNMENHQKNPGNVMNLRGSVPPSPLLACAYLFAQIIALLHLRQESSAPNNVFANSLR